VSARVDCHKVQSSRRGSRNANLVERHWGRGRDAVDEDLDKGLQEGVRVRKMRLTSGSKKMEWGL